MLIPLRARDGAVRAHAYVDDADASLAGWAWRLATNGYVVRYSQREGTVYLHREVLRLKPGESVVDHRNGNRLDNRRSNLRPGSQGQNMQNLRGPYASNRGSRHRGVSWDRARGHWRAAVTLAGRSHHLGRFENEEEAAAAARAFRRQHMPFSEEDR